MPASVQVRSIGGPGLPVPSAVLWTAKVWRSGGVGQGRPGSFKGGSSIDLLLYRRFHLHRELLGKTPLSSATILLPRLEPEGGEIPIEEYHEIAIR